jgi:signal recognition particle subunit SRP54
MASRILGMGDMLSLIEKAEQNFDMKKAAELEEKIRKSRFTLTDYLDQMSQLKNMGSLESLLGMMPGMSSSALKDANFDENILKKTEAIILSMTPAEREKPEIISYSRKMRIAKGSGTTIEDVNRLLKQFDQTNKLMKQFAGPKGAKKLAKFGGGKMPF